MSALSIILGIILGCNILLFCLLWINLRKGKRKMDDNEVFAVRDSVSNLITDLNRVANTNINILEDKTEDLKKLLALADEKILRLNSILVDLGITLQRAEKDKAAKEEISELPLPTDKTAVRNTEEPVIKKPAKPARKEVSPPAPPAKKLSLEERKERIYELISAGFAMEDIARAVNMSQSEVQLVLGLKDKS